MQLHQMKHTNPAAPELQDPLASQGGQRLGDYLASRPDRFSKLFVSATDDQRGVCSRLFRASMTSRRWPARR